MTVLNAHPVVSLEANHLRGVHVLTHLDKGRAAGVPRALRPCICRLLYLSSIAAMAAAARDSR